MTVLIIIFLSIGSAFLCQQMAESRSRCPRFWGTMGLFFGLAAVIALALQGQRVRADCQ